MLYMNEQDILKQLKIRLAEAYIRKQHEILDVLPESRLEEDLHLDSLDRIELWMDLESIFKISIPETELKQINTVQDVVNLVKKYVK